MSPQTYKKITRGTGIVLTACVIFVIGAYAGTKTSIAKIINPQDINMTSAELAASHDLSEFWDVWNLMQKKYPFAKQAPTDENKIYGAISGLVDSYKDPYTVFFPPQESKLFDAQVKGSFGGVGMEVGSKDGFITVVAPLKDSPAEKAGVLAGDIITEVGKKKTDGLDIDTVISMIRGTVGTPVELGIARKDAGEILYISIVRDVVKLPVLDTAEEDDVFIINLYSFSEDSAKLFTEALGVFNTSGKHKLIIDLRNNPGGYLESAVSIASYFIPQGKAIVRENTGVDTKETVHESKGYTLLKNNPEIVILMNGGSASASEILAGALSEYNLATLIGTKSYGKGSVQEVIKLNDGSSVKITIAKWMTPKGVSISEKGITPDIIIDERPVKDEKTGKYNDPQLEAALKQLQ